jgi:queuine tRNA-ribosyltransferase
MAPALPDLIFYDMFSSRTHGDEWTVEAFRPLFSVCGHRPAELFTYSTSTAVRVALLAAGFHVAKGRSAGVKQETTIALIPGYPLPCRHTLLAADWLAKWHRSHAKYPEGLPEEERAAFERTITGHPQFVIGAEPQSGSPTNRGVSEA